MTKWALLALLACAAFAFTVPVVAGQEFCFVPDDTGFVTIDFDGANASFSIITDTSAYQDFFELITAGNFSVHHRVSVNTLERAVTLFDRGRVSAITYLPNGVIQIELDGCGSFHEDLAISGRFNPTYVYVWVDVDYADSLYLAVLDGLLLAGTPPPRPKPKLRLVSLAALTLAAGGGGSSVPGIPVKGSRQAVNPPRAPLSKGSVGNPGPSQAATSQTSHTGTEVLLTVVNFGDAPLTGEARVTVGLSYAKNWVAETFTQFFGGSFGEGSVLPKGETTFRLVVPDVPAWAVEALEVGRILWTSYDDPEPDQDYVCITLRIGEERVVGYMPLIR